jgi:Fuc2NAc and GlcNAc transferase
MVLELTVHALVALALTAFLTGLVRKLALARGIVDTPNARSSHSKVTPRGGGVAIAVVIIGAVVVAWWRGLMPTPVAAALLGGGIPVAWIGFVDDRRSVPVLVRMLVHLLSAAWSIYMLGGVAPLQLGEHVVDLGMAGNLLGVVALVWVINLFNFMDGIDGIAGSEGAFVCWAGAGLAILSGGSPAVAIAGAVVGGACCGFLRWNWPPAGIFMGDTGSGFLGFVIAVLALADGHTSPAAPFVWLILGGVFFVDATVTFLRRLVRRAAVFDAHREHAYQWQSRRWKSHRTVVLWMLGLNLGWLLPCAWYASIRPEHAVLAALTGLLPLVVLAALAGSGRPETPT